MLAFWSTIVARLRLQQIVDMLSTTEPLRISVVFFVAYGSSVVELVRY